MLEKKSKHVPMIFLKNNDEINKLRACNLIVLEVLDTLESLIKEGISTYELDKYAEEMTIKKGAQPAFKGYRGFPASLCISLNDEVVHGIPSKKRIIKSGDIVSIDYGVYLHGYYGDSARTVGVGNISDEAKKLIRVTREALDLGIEQCRVGNRLGDISFAIESHAKKYTFGVVRDFVGHGIGRNLHEDPQIPNYGAAHSGLLLQKGMVFAIEPMFNLGTEKVCIQEDEWTAVTLDHSISAHFEHSVAILDKGPFILSKL